nr:aminotransferase class V-fold PLP-dependent enzyme [Eubacterium sp.]
MIYLDNSATTRPTEEVIEKVAQAMREDFGNPSSLHKKGIDAEKFIREAKKTIAGSLKVREGNIVFTSGGTESNNYSIIGSALAYQRTGKHIVTTEIEHPSVSAVTDYLVQQGFEVTYLKPDKTGKITIDELKNAIRPDTILVSIMTVNNEIGTIQDIEELAKTAKEINPEIRFHTDAVQAYAKTELKPGKWGVDLMSV